MSTIKCRRFYQAFYSHREANQKTIKTPHSQTVSQAISRSIECSGTPLCDTHSCTVRSILRTVVYSYPARIGSQCTAHCTNSDTFRDSQLGAHMCPQLRTNGGTDRVTERFAIRNAHN